MLFRAKSKNHYSFSYKTYQHGITYHADTISNTSMMYISWSNSVTFFCGANMNHSMKYIRYYSMILHKYSSLFDACF